MTPADLPEALGKVRDLTRRYLSGTPDAFDAVRELIDYILRITVMAGNGVVRFSSMEGGRKNARAIGVHHQPIPLNNGHFLRILQSLRLDDIPNNPSKLRVYVALYQYQIDSSDGEQWVFRYEYLRTPKDPHPSSHIHIRGNLQEHQHCLATTTLLEHLHFPTGRITIEAVIRCLVEQFGIETNEPPEIWRPVLTEAELEFERIAHRHASGPSA